MTNEQANELAKNYEQAWAVYRKKRVYATYKGNGWFYVRHHNSLCGHGRSMRTKAILESLDLLIDRAA